MEMYMKFSFVFLCFVNFSLVFGGYPKYIIEDACKVGNETIVYDTTQSGAVGILKATARPPYAPDKNCVITIVPPNDHGIVLSVQKIDLRQKGFSCMDYIKIFHSDTLGSPVTLCRFKFDLKGRLSFYSNGPMEIVYHVEPEGYRGFNYEEGFSITYTVVTDDVKVCMKDDVFMCQNGLCIPNYLKCDGQNNCGDRSEETHELCDVVDLSVFQIVDVGYFIVFSILVFSIIVTCMITRRRHLARSNRESTQDAMIPAATHPLDPKLGHPEFANYNYPPPPPPYSQ